MTTPTNDPVPSLLPQNLLFNTEKLDEMLNSTELTFTDRNGVVRPTAKGIAEGLAALAVVTAAVQARDTATAQATLAGTYKDQALSAAATALTNGKLYATKADGMAATAATALPSNAFWVLPNTSDSLARITPFLKTGASTSTVVPTSMVTGAEFDLLQAQLNSTALVSVGRISALATVTGAVPAKVYLRDQVSQKTGLVSRLFVDAAAAGNVTLKVYDLLGNAATQVGPDVVIAVPAAGAQVIDLTAALPIKAGQRAALYGPGVVRYLGGTPPGLTYGFFEPAATGNVGNFTTSLPSAAFGNDFGWGIYVLPMAYEAALTKVVANEKNVADLQESITPTAGTALGRTAALASPAGAVPSTTYTRLQSFADDRTIQSVFVDAAAAGNVTFYVQDWDGVSLKQSGSSFTVAVPAAGAQTIAVTSQFLGAGQVLGAYGPGVLRYQGGGVAAFPFVEAAGSTGSSTPVLAPSLGNEIAYGVFARSLTLVEVRQRLASVTQRIAALPTLIAAGVPVIGEVVSDATVAIAGTVATVSATVARNGVANATYTGTPAITLAAAGKVRYDILVLDMVAGTFSIVQGTARSATTPIDPTVYSPEATLTLQQAPIAKLRVTSSAATAILQHDLVDGTLRSLAAEMQQRRARSQGRLRRFRGGMTAAKPLRIIGVGDSVTGLQYAASDSSLLAAPNGPIRDRASDNSNPAAAYLPVNYGSDYLSDTSKVPLYTSAQLGRGTYSPTAVHTRLGWNWELVAALEARGYVLGTDLRYDNFAVASQQTSGLVSGSTPSAWMSAITALITSSVSAGERVLVVLSFGLNELGNVDTATRMQTIIGLLKAAGADVIVMGLPRPLDSFSAPANQQYTNRALTRAAEVGGAAFAPIYDLVEGERLRAMGIFSADLAEANHLHHPGVTELAFYGRELARHVV